MLGVEVIVSKSGTDRMFERIRNWYQNAGGKTLDGYVHTHKLMAFLKSNEPRSKESIRVTFRRLVRRKKVVAAKDFDGIPMFKVCS
jgi:ribonuclease HII